MDDVAVGDEDELHCPTGGRSWVWRYFKVDPIDSGCAVCTLPGCGERISRRGDGTTKNMVRHLRSSKHSLGPDGPLAGKQVRGQRRLQLA